MASNQSPLHKRPLDQSREEVQTFIPPKEADIKKICLKHCPSWTNYVTKEDHVTISTVSGGLTNLLWRATVNNELQPKEGVPRDILVRVFGAGTDKYISRSLEVKIAEAMGNSGFGPKVLGLFEGGRIEQFLHARTLKTHDLHDPVISSKIGDKLGKLHTMQLDIDKGPKIVPLLQSWYEAALKVSQSQVYGGVKWRARRLQSFSFSSIKKFMQTTIEAMGASKSPVVFSHNDLQEGNIMMDTQGNIVFIDFEYGGYNYRGFDFANHFCEWSINYCITGYPRFVLNPDHYPTKEQQYGFFRAYFKAQGNEPTEKDLEMLYKEVQLFSLASHLLWALWGIVQAHESEINFGYLEFAMARLDQFYVLQEQHLK